MASNQNPINTIIGILADGWEMSAGQVLRKFKITGGDVTVVGGGYSNTISFPTGTATVFSTAPGEIALLTEKATPVDADVFMEEDSAASMAKKKTTWADIKTTLKSYFPLAMHGQAGTVAAGATSYLNPYQDGLNATAFAWIAGRAGTLKNLYFRKSGTQPGGGTLTVTVRVNAVTTAITVTVPAGDVGNNNFSDTTHTVVIAAGDSVDVEVHNNAGSASCGVRACSVEVETSLTS